MLVNIGNLNILVRKFAMISLLKFKLILRDGEVTIKGGILVMYKSVFCHLHSICEGPASVAWNCYAAKKAGVDMVWISDHDSRIPAQWPIINELDFYLKEDEDNKIDYFLKGEKNKFTGE